MYECMYVGMNVCIYQYLYVCMYLCLCVCSVIKIACAGETLVFQNWIFG